MLADLVQYTAEYASANIDDLMGCAACRTDSRTP
jgi:hypothetical protein